MLCPRTFKQVPLSANRASCALLLFFQLALLISTSSVLAAEPEPRIIHGNLVTATNIPTARLIITTDTMSALCSSVVLSPNVLISAAHCFAGIGSVLSITVLASDGTKAYGLAYSVDPLNDLSYVRLDRNLSKQIKPAKVSSVAPRRGEDFLVLGYGQDDLGIPGHLISGTMKMYAAYGGIMVLVSAPGGTIVCHGDSGGPAFLFRKGKPYLVGIASVGEATCTQGLAGYTSVLSASAKRFLKAALKKPKQRQ